MGEFRGKHTDKCITGGAGLVAFCIGGDILGADAEGGVFLEGDDFDMVDFFAKLIVVRGGGGKYGGGVVGHNADGATEASQNGFELECFLAG